MFGIAAAAARSGRVAYSLELIGRGSGPADGRDLAHEMLRYAVGDRAAGHYAAAFRDEVLAKLSPTGWELTEREILSWLQAR